MWKLFVGWVVGDELNVRTDTALFHALATAPRQEWHWAATELFRRDAPGAFEAALARGRSVTLAWGAALLALVGIAAWRWGGAVAGCIAVAMVGLDPTFLAHAALVTNDIPFATVALGFSLALARWTTGPTLGKACTLGALAGVGLLVKFSAIAFLPMFVLAGAWALHRGPARRRVSLGIGIAFLTAYVTLWAGYGFRNQPLPMEPELRGIMDLTHDSRPPAPARLTAWLGDHSIVPPPMARGLLTQSRIAQRSRAFIFGQNREPVPWYTLPLGWGLKTPIALIALVGIGLLRPGTSRPHALKNSNVQAGQDARVTTRRTLLICAGVILALALLSGRGRGIRYLLPALPILYLLAAMALAPLARAVQGKLLLSALAAALTFELFLARANYLAHFNLPSRTLGEPWTLLGDSNLDWGQGLLELAGWRKANPTETVYLAYFGTADPRAYGLTDLHEAAPGFLLRPNATEIPKPGSLLAISATLLQGTYLPDDLKAQYAPYLQKGPIAVLAGGSILIFRVE